MKISIITVGQKMPTWVDEGFSTYQTRMPFECGLDLIEVPAVKRHKSKTTATITAEERDLINKTIRKFANPYIIALDEKGSQWSSQSLAQDLNAWFSLGQDIIIIIGGPDGLHYDIKNSAHKTASLSRLTLPHPLVRIVLAEQIYRALSILKNHPYHRE
jgi:23S rRNA (pseudouridine1915-N3)-methyltransferase